MKTVVQFLLFLALSTLFSGCYLHMGWGSPVVVTNQLQQPTPQPVDSGYYRE
jgi:hypothetical protein